MDSFLGCMGLKSKGTKDWAMCARISSCNAWFPEWPLLSVIEAGGGGVRRLRPHETTTHWFWTPDLSVSGPGPVIQMYCPENHSSQFQEIPFRFKGTIFTRPYTPPTSSDFPINLLWVKAVLPISVPFREWPRLVLFCSAGLSSGTRGSMLHSMACTAQPDAEQSPAEGQTPAKATSAGGDVHCHNRPPRPAAGVSRPLQAPSVPEVCLKNCHVAHKHQSLKNCHFAHKHQRPQIRCLTECHFCCMKGHHIPCALFSRCGGVKLECPSQASRRPPQCTYRGPPARSFGVYTCCATLIKGRGERDRETEREQKKSEHKRARETMRYRERESTREKQTAGEGERERESNRDWILKEGETERDYLEVTSNHHLPRCGTWGSTWLWGSKKRTFSTWTFSHQSPSGSATRIHEPYAGDRQQVSNCCHPQSLFGFWKVWTIQLEPKRLTEWIPLAEVCVCDGK